MFNRLGPCMTMSTLSLFFSFALVLLLAGIVQYSASAAAETKYYLDDCPSNTTKPRNENEIVSDKNEKAKKRMKRKPHGRTQDRRVCVGPPAPLTVDV